MSEQQDRIEAEERKLRRNEMEEQRRIFLRRSRMAAMAREALDAIESGDENDYYRLVMKQKALCEGDPPCTTAT